ncbi:cytochrome P450 [Vitiosangium sp. GDMCC 1.1324]|uniref:cytochrome P450 family protein n=1 Tax=Vitiosangium sp. (strain GDMCC 1.1324) TaxID=2138576 RepID=UPI000D36EF84|nr:cytochrome P450 [Vitiosangium sp. GDMCC 1.1324]PTL78897.1 cytochrome P450 [Vitiosangium sp. GDMCC 1.1324]
MAARDANAAKEQTSPEGPMTLTLDPKVSPEDYAKVREKDRVARVSFTFGENAGQAGADPELREFLEREHLFITRYDDVIAALLDDRISSDPRTAMTPEQQKKIPQVPEELRPISKSLISVDPPDHSRLRKLIQPSFTPRAMEPLRARIQRIAEDLLDAAERAAAERGESRPDRHMELIAEFAYPLPVTVISDMLGIPCEDRKMVRAWTEDLFGGNRGRGLMDPESRAKLREFTDYLRRLFVAKRTQPADDMISQLLRIEEDGDKLNEEETLSTVFILYLAGHVTTVNLIGNGVYALLSHPEQLAKLKANPGLVKGMVEETLRYWGPVDFISRRIAKEDLDMAGTHIPKGEPMMVGLASANRDPARFSHPDVFDITRPDADKHVAFGKGIHICIGAPLARMEGQIAFETLFRRMPELRLAIPSEELRWSNSFLRGFAKLPVLF